MPTDDRPTPPERVHISYGDADLLAAMGPLPGDHTYRLSDPADPLVRLSEVREALLSSWINDFRHEPDIEEFIHAITVRLTAERGEGGVSSGEGK